MTSKYYDGAMNVKADLIKFMQDIIRIPSLSSEEGAVIQRIRDEMLRLDYDEVTVDPMGNLLGRIGSGPRVIALIRSMSAILHSGIGIRTPATSRTGFFTGAAPAT
jgi:hypothetical protein